MCRSSCSLAGPVIGMPPQTPCPCATFGPWKPPGIGGCPWPADEYLCDGGVQGFGVHVRTDWKIDGLEQEDTFVHADTLDNRTIVEPSNRVCIYAAPRFAAVRKVDVPYDDSQFEGPVPITQPIKPSSADESQGTFVADQPLEPFAGEVGSRGPNAIVERQRGIDLGGIQGLAAVYDRIKPYEDFTYIRAGIVTEQDKPLLAQSVQNAIAWTGNQALEIQMDGRRAKTLIDEKRVQVEYTVDVPNHPRLQVCKIASTNNAQPGETVDFTIRFDNVGDQKIGNVTIVDSLTTRLEYVPGTAISSLKGDFSTQPNEAGSLRPALGTGRPLARQPRRRGPLPVQSPLKRGQNYYLPAAAVLRGRPRGRWRRSRFSFFPNRFSQPSLP